MKMREIKSFRYIFEILLFLVLLVVDQGSKYLAYFFLKDQGVKEIIPGIIDLRYLENRGAAYGILQNRMFLFYVLTVVILIGIIYFKIRIYKVINNSSLNNKTIKKFNILNWTLVFLSAGAIGNFLDRIRLNYVIDFLNFSFIDFPVFNVADICITLSAIFLLILFVFVFKNKDLEHFEKKRAK